MKNADKEKIIAVVLRVVKEIGKENNDKTLLKATSETPLYGYKSNLDSLMLVRLITDIEESISEEFGKEIVIADERAMSLKHSPFLTVGSLADYISLIISGENE